MSTHNVCFYGEITKIIPKSSLKPSLSVSLKQNMIFSHVAPVGFEPVTNSSADQVH